jgi:Cof subfamily protein (haloacid dehalogenase superfamily)
MDHISALIALDIDGTVTHDMKPIPREVINFLHELAEKGYLLIFVTGRTFHFASQVLKLLNCSYAIAVQNGAFIVEMPSEKIVMKHYLTESIIPTMEEICFGEPTDFVIYGGYELGDLCFYRPSHFSSELLDYLKSRQKAFGETWKAVNSFEECYIREFPSVKCFGHLEFAQKVAKEIVEKLGLYVPVIRDPFNENYYVVQATHPIVSKRRALQDFIKQKNFSGVVIAAGDDENDTPMLEFADIAVVMSTAPEEVKKWAKIIAPSAKELGVIPGINQALQQLVKGKIL